MDAGSDDLAILPEDVASSSSCGDLALWRDKDYVLTCSDRDIDTDLSCPRDLTSPLHPGFPLLGNSFSPIVDLIPLFPLCPLPEEEPPTLDPCLVLSLGSPPPYALPLLSVDPLPNDNPLLLEFCPSSPSGSLPRDDLFLPDSCPSPTLCDLCLPYLPHSNAPELEEDLFFSCYPSPRCFLVPDLHLKFRPEDPLVIDLSLKPWPDDPFLPFPLITDPDLKSWPCDPSPPVVENPCLKLGSLDHLFYPERDLEVQDGVLSALYYAHDQWHSSPIWDEEERFDLFLFSGYRDPFLSFEDSLTDALVASDSYPWPYSSWPFVPTGWRMNPSWGTSSSLRVSLLSLFILFFFSVALVLPSYEVLPYVLDVLILCLWVVFYPLFPSYWHFFGNPSLDS